jgi:hypothetical protein
VKPLVALLLLLSLSASRAATFSAQRVKSFRQLLPLKKITVGPDDQFQATIDPGGTFLVFTHKADLVSHLRMQNLADGRVTDLLPLDADSQDASFSPEGHLTFAYYKFNARGDICYVDHVTFQSKTLTDRDIQCLKRPTSEAGSERSSPFWLSGNDLGFVVRDINTQSTKIVVENLRTHVLNTITQGKVWAPAMRSGGRFLVYSSVDPTNGHRILVLRDLQTNETRQLHLSLPGVSGFSAISDDEHFVYFSHFLNDTNQDNAIDGNDNAVIFRLPIAKIFAQKEGSQFLPEQLTPVEDSCSFPRPFADSLYVTCAFENALDIYQIPTSGIVPADWSKDVLESALRTSRSYAERVLILNTLRYRTPGAGLPFAALLLSNHLLAEDTAAARYYLVQLAAQSPAERAFYDLLRVYLDATELKKAQPAGQITRAFEEQLNRQLGVTNSIKSEARLKQIVRGHLYFYLDNPSHALQAFDQVSFGDKSQPLERYLYFQLAEQLLRGKENQPRLLKAVHEMLKAPELSEESRIYYAFNALRAIEAFDHAPQKRIAAIEGLKLGLPKDVTALLDVEIESLRIPLENNDSIKTQHYQALAKLILQAKDDYFLRKAMNVRATLNFTAFAEFKYLRAIATNWLRDTAKLDTEFIYSREVLSSSSLDQAYGYYGQKKWQLSADFFFEDLTLTDDLEGHAGFIRVMLIQGLRPTLDVRYNYLTSHNLIADNYLYVQALLGLTDAETISPKDSLDTSALDQAIRKLEAMQDNRDSGVRYLLLGYAYLEKMRRTAAGLEFDNSLFQEAHRALMLAYDQGRDNDRVRAAALVNLGLLHQRSANYGLSAKFFALRKKLGFDDPEEQARFTWYYAKSLFHSYQVEQAAREISELPEKVISEPLRERQAFYLSMAGQGAKAAEIYRKVLLSPEVQSSTVNMAKVNLGYGYALFKMRDVVAAQSALNIALDSATKLKTIGKGRERLMDFEPLRIQLIAAGLLSQMGTPEERIRALKIRGQLLSRAKDVIDEWQPNVILNSLRLAELEVPAAAAAELDVAVQNAQTFASTNGYLGNAIYRTAANALSFGLLSPQSVNPKSTGALQELVSKNLAAMDAQKPAPSILVYEKVKLALLWSAYQQKILGHQATPTIQQTLTSDSAQEVKEELPEKWQELEQLAKAL